jgi:MoxR-like ATPase
VASLNGNAPLSADGFANLFQAISGNIERVIHGKLGAIQQAVMCLVAEGHLLVEDVPGVGKTWWV